MIVTGTILRIGSNQPYPNANVRVQGTERGVQANAKGEYKIDVNIGETLVFTHVTTKDNWTKKIASMFDSKVDVFLLEGLDLPEITVTNKPTTKKDNNWLLWLLAAGTAYGIYKYATQEKPLKVKI